VLLAYEYRCCVCGQDLRMGGHAWVATWRGSKPRTSSGSRRAGRTWCKTTSRFVPSTTRSFDLGAFTVLPGNQQIVFSRQLHLAGGDDTKAKLLAHHGAGLIEPQGRECLPQPEFLAWHRAEVFKEPARE
jgi:putative restriction endonuclease